MKEIIIFIYPQTRCRPGNRDTCELYDADIIIQPTQIKDNMKGLCKGRHFNYIRHPHDCDKAIFCYNGNPILKECPLNNVFDISTERYGFSLHYLNCTTSQNKL